MSNNLGCRRGTLPAGGRLNPGVVEWATSHPSIRGPATGGFPGRRPTYRATTRGSADIPLFRIRRSGPAGSARGGGFGEGRPPRLPPLLRVGLAKCRVRCLVAGRHRGRGPRSGIRDGNGSFGLAPVCQVPPPGVVLTPYTRLCRVPQTQSTVHATRRKNSIFTELGLVAGIVRRVFQANGDRVVAAERRMRAVGTLACGFCWNWGPSPIGDISVNGGLSEPGKPDHGRRVWPSRVRRQRGR
jgi:hypothetical protein